MYLWHPFDVVDERCCETRFVVPPLVECFENVYKLFLFQPVEMRYHCIELMNHVFFYVWIQGTIFGADKSRKTFESFVRAG
jgi:hypothetical protein